MINAPQVVVDALSSGDFKYADIVDINLGDAYDTGFDVVLHYTNYHTSISFGGETYTPNQNISELAGISRKASTGSDKVDIVFDITDESIIDIIKSERYINKPTSIKRVIIENGNVLADFAIPIRTAWGLSHESSGDTDDRSITLTTDSSLGDLKGDNGWYAVNSSHQRRHPNDLIMNHSGTVMTEDQQDKYTTNFNGTINQQIKPPSLPKIYGYKNVEAIPIAMLKHRKTHTSYRHYFTTMIYVLNIGDCDHVDIDNIKKGGDDFDVTVVNNNDRDVGGWSCRVRTPADAENSSLLDEESADLSFWFEGMDSAEISRMTGMYGKGLTLLFLKNRNRDDWLNQAPKITIPIRGSRVFDPRTGLTEFSRNPALQYADFLRSADYGAGQRGILVTDSNIGEIADHFVQIPDSIGNDGINSILIDVQLDTGDPIVDNMNIWMEGVRLFTSDYYGEFNIRVETKSPVVLSIDEDDLEGFPDYNSGEFTDRLNQLTYSIKQLVQDNTDGALPGDLVEVDVEATFPADGSQIHTDWLAEDGGIDNFDSTALDYVTDLEQAYYWAMVDSRVSRQPRELELPMGAIAWLLETGDVIKFSSKILNMTDVLWRVDEVSEDDGISSVKNIAYDDSFYTPDPSAIPEPVAFAKPPTGANLSPVSGLAIIEKGGLYYLDWTPLSSANIVWYALEITKDGTLTYDEPKLAQPPFLLDAITIGSYVVSMTSVGHEDEGGVATLSFDIALPETPVINTTVGNFSIEVYPSVSVTYLGSTFELVINNADDFATGQNKGTSGSFTVANLVPNTQYWIWCRTVNSVGKSDWAKIDVLTSNDNTSLVNFVGLDRQSIIDDSVNEMQTQINDTVNSAIDGAVSGAVDEAVAEIQDSINGITGEGSQQNTIDLINGIFDNVENAEKSFSDDAEIKIETNTLKVSVENAESSITETNKVIADLDESVAIRFSSVNSSTENNIAKINRVDKTVTTIEKSVATSISEISVSTEENKASIISLDQVVTDLDSATTTSINELSSSLDDNASDISTLNQTVADLDSATATSINTLTTNVGSNTSGISTLNQTVADLDSATATSLSELSSSVGDNSADIISLDQTVVDLDSATAISLNQLSVDVGNRATTTQLNSVESKADGNTSAISSLSTEVNNIDGEVSAAQLILTSHTNDIGELESRAFLGVDVGGLIAGIYINGSPSQTDIEFKADTVSFVNPDTNQKDLYYDAASKRLIFDGIIEVGTLIRSPKIEFIGPTHMRVSAADGFGSTNQFIEWFGLKLMNGSDIDYSAMTEGNAITYLKTNGDAYFGGSLSAGLLKNAAQTSVINSYVVDSNPIEIGPFNTNGNVKSVVVSWTLKGSSLEAGSCGVYGDPSFGWSLERRIGIGAWSIVVSGTFNGNTIGNPEAGNCIVTEDANEAYTYTEPSTSVDNFSYRVKVDSYTRHHANNKIGSQRLSLISTEE